MKVEQGEEGEMKKFPRGFLWGAATSAYQVEGGITNTDWSKAANEGRVPPVGEAADHYHRFEEDFDIAKSLGHTAHRISIEWARIEPEEGRFDEEAIDHYRRVLMALRARDLEPFVTLWHFTLPLWFSESGGFLRKDASDVFARYAAFAVSRLGDLATRFATMNEPNSVIIPGYIRGTWPPFKRFPLMTLVSLPMANSTGQVPTANWRAPYDLIRLTSALARSHNAAYREIKNTRPNSEISLVFQVFVWEGGKNWLTRVGAQFLNQLMNALFMNKVYASCDAIGVNHYFYRIVGGKSKRAVSDLGWELYPEKIYDSLRFMKRYRKPLYVAEVGVADSNDIYREKYIRDAVRAVWRAIHEGIDVRGFLYWSLLDNYEWGIGYGASFGLVAVDFETQVRTIRQSAYYYKRICEENRVE